MKSFSKMLNVAKSLDDNDVLVPSALRVEFKRTKSGHFRLYIACGAGVKYSVMAHLEPLLEGKGVTANPFAKAGVVTAITFVDDAEDTSDVQDKAQG